MLFNYMVFLFYCGGVYGWYVTSKTESKLAKLWYAIAWPFDIGAEIAARQIENNRERFNDENL